MKEKYLIIWPKSKDVKHINYHFSHTLGDPLVGSPKAG